MESKQVTAVSYLIASLSSQVHGDTPHVYIVKLGSYLQVYNLFGFKQNMTLMWSYILNSFRQFELIIRLFTNTLLLSISVLCMLVLAFLP